MCVREREREREGGVGGDGGNGPGCASRFCFSTFAGRASSCSCFCLFTSCLAIDARPNGRLRLSPFRTWLAVWLPRPCFDSKLCARTQDNECATSAGELTCLVRDMKGRDRGREGRAVMGGSHATPRHRYRGAVFAEQPTGRGHNRNKMAAGQEAPKTRLQLAHAFGFVRPPRFVRAAKIEAGRCRMGGIGTARVLPKGTG